MSGGTDLVLYSPPTSSSSGNKPTIKKRKVGCKKSPGNGGGFSQATEKRHQNNHA